MKNLGDFPELDKWLDDNERIITHEVHASMYVVDIYEVELKLIELGTKIEELEDEVRLLGIGLSREVNFHRS